MSSGIYPLEVLDDTQLAMQRAAVCQFSQEYSAPALAAWEKLRGHGIQLLDCQAQGFGSAFKTAMDGQHPGYVEHIAATARIARDVYRDKTKGDLGRAFRIHDSRSAWDAGPTTVALAYQMAEAYKKELACPTK